MISRLFIENLSGTSGKPNALKQYNYRLIIHALQNKEAASAAQLSSETGLSKTTVSKILTELMKYHLIEYVGKGVSTAEGGKKPDMFAFYSGYALTIVVSIYGEQCFRCSLTDLTGRILYEKEYSFPEKPDYPSLLEQLQYAIQETWILRELDARTLCGIAIGYNGVADTDAGKILFPMNSADAAFLPLCSDLAARLPNCPFIFVDNIGYFSGYAELTYNNTDDYNRMAVISCDENVHGCTLSSVRQRPGNRGIVGEFGHIILDASQPASCCCGSNGCLESLISNHAILARAQKLCSQYPDASLSPKSREGNLTINDILSAAAAEDSFAHKILKPMADYWAILIHNLIVLENVNKVIIQGSYARAGQPFLNYVCAQVRKLNRFDRNPDFTVEFSKWSLQGPESDKTAPVYGAARYIANDYLDTLVSKWFSTHEKKAENLPH